MCRTSRHAYALALGRARCERERAEDVSFDRRTAHSTGVFQRARVIAVAFSPRPPPFAPQALNSLKFCDSRVRGQLAETKRMWGRSA